MEARGVTYRIDRPALVAIVLDAVRGRPDVVAAWEGGSAAWGRADAWSDADLQLLAVDEEPATIAAIFAAVEGALEAAGGIRGRFVVPEPAWHGHSQRFYHVADAGPYVMLDLVVVHPGVAERFLAPEQHGHAIVHLGGGDDVAAPAFDAAAHRVRLRRAFEEAVGRFDLFQPLVTKEVVRGHFIDAIAFYHGLTLRPLVVLLGIAHRPLRFDFGARYLHDDLPEADAAALAELYAVRDLDDLADKHARACAWFRVLADGIDVEAIDLEGASAALRG